MDVEVLTWGELVRHAGSSAKARTLVEHGEWWQVCRGAYASWLNEDRPQVRLAALHRVLPPGVAVSHRTALWLLGMDVLGPALEVTVGRDRQLRQRQGLLVREAALPDEELCLVGDLLVVSAARAAVDVARSEPLVEAVAVVDAALRAGHADLPGLQDCLERAGRLRGVCSAREALRHAEPRSESPQESRLRMQLVLGGVPRPVAQYDVYGPTGHVGRADLWLEGVVLEFDGREVHLRPGVFARERHRQGGMLDLELEVRRFTAVDVFRRDRADLCAEVWRAVDLAAGRSRPGLRSGPDTLPRPAHRPLPTLAAPRAAA